MKHMRTISKVGKICLSSIERMAQISNKKAWVPGQSLCVSLGLDLSFSVNHPTDVFHFMEDETSSPGTPCLLRVMWIREPPPCTDTCAHAVWTPTDTCTHPCAFQIPAAESLTGELRTEVS